MKHTPAIEIAKHFIASFQKNENAITNLKLQKLLYYAQAWHLALYGTALFNDKIEAWVHGPVVPNVFREYKKYSWNPISVSPTNVLIHSSDIQFHLKQVIRVYGKFDATTLERMTHRESPWMEARGTLAPDEPSNRVINLESMKTFYRARLNG